MHAHALTLLLSLTLVTACGDKDGGASGGPDGASDGGDGADGGSDGADGSDGTDGLDGGDGSDGGDGGGVEVTDCGTSLETPSDDAVCGVVGEVGANNALWLRGDVLMDGEVLRGGSVVISDGVIICSGCDCDASVEDLAATQIDCPDGAISPGLINPHDHLGYTEGAPIDTGTQRWDHRHGWRGSLSTPQNSSTSNGSKWGELRQVIAGTTSLVGSGWGQGMLRNLDEDAHNEGLAVDEVLNQTFPLGDSGERFEANCGWDYRYSESRVAGENAYVPHVAEGIDDYAWDEFLCQSGEVERSVDHTEPNTAHIHSIGLTARDYWRMAQDEAQIIWSPRSNIALYGHTAQVTTFHRLGGVLALGTDWSYSGSIHMGRELSCADSLNQQQYDGYFTDHDLWLMATRNPAIATGTEALLGTLETGKVADIAVFSTAGSDNPFRAIIDVGPDGAALVLRGGEPLWGEAAVVQALDASCEAFTDACAEPRALCSTREWGVDVATVQAAIPGAYGALFCAGEPTGEPTCTPYRTGEFDGLPDSDDLDGDGLLNADDNCPSVFNPVRPMDEGAQPDADGDGEGDPCDATPLGTDLDGDGFANEDDNCPWTANADQSDIDGDDKGDACDLCPDLPNAHTGCPVSGTNATIDELRTSGTFGDGDFVEVVGLVVTGVAGSGFTAQDPTDSDGQYSGIYVYTGGAPTVSRGDEITVLGELGDYFGEAQLQNPTVISTGTGAITPAQVSASVAATEAYEGVLVEISDGSVTNAAYDCSVDGSACSDSGLWEIEGAAGVLVYDRLYEDADWADHVGDIPVVGVMNYRFDRRRVMPRDADDFAP